MMHGNKVDSPWGRYLVTQINAATVFDLVFMKGRVQRGQSLSTIIVDSNEGYSVAWSACISELYAQFLIS